MPQMAGSPFARPAARNRDLGAAFTLEGLCIMAISPRTASSHAARPSAIGRADRAALGQAIGLHIIPRLRMVSPASGAGRSAEPRVAAAIAADAIAELAPLALSREPGALLRRAARLIGRGVPAEQVMTQVLASAARHLGELWAADACDFVAVSIGVSRLQLVMRALNAQHPAPPVPGPQRSALVAAMPGDQHSFGVLMLEMMLGRGGWDTEALIAPSQAELLSRVAACPFDLVGLSAGGDAAAAALPALVRAVRAASANPGVKLMVGGPMLLRCPELAAISGADGAAGDAAAAVALAGALVGDSRSKAVPAIDTICAG